MTDLRGFDWDSPRGCKFSFTATPEMIAALERIFMTDHRELDPDQPIAIDDKDPGNSDPDDFTAPLDPDDNVFALVNQDQGDLLENAPVGEQASGD